MASKNSIPTWSDEQEFLPDEIVALMDTFICTGFGTRSSYISTNASEGLRRIHKRGLIKRTTVRKSAEQVTPLQPHFSLTKLGLKVANTVIANYTRRLQQQTISK